MKTVYGSRCNVMKISKEIYYDDDDTNCMKNLTPRK